MINDVGNTVYTARINRKDQFLQKNENDDWTVGLTRLLSKVDFVLLNILKNMIDGDVF